MAAGRGATSVTGVSRVVGTSNKRGRSAGAGGRQQQVGGEEEEPVEDMVSTWAIMLDIWPLEDRPEKMTNPRIVNEFSFDQMIKYKKSYESLMKKEGKGEGVFGKDNKLPTKKYAGAEDNCLDILHPAR
jgi:hypothetical protein